MELPDSYEALYQRANDAARRGDFDEAVAHMKRLVARLTSLPPHILERRPDLRDLLDDAAGGFVVLLRWSGRHEEALSELQRLEPRISHRRPYWELERALNTIDHGNVSEGLDMLRALLIQHTGIEREVRRTLALELWGAGQYAEAESVTAGLLSVARDETEIKDALGILMGIMMDKNDLGGVIRCSAEFDKRAHREPYVLYEWLASRGHWDELERQLKGLKEHNARRVFLAEIRRARGDEDGARKTWQAILDEVNEDEDVYAAICATLLLQQTNGETLRDIVDVLNNMPTDSSAVLALVAALAQMGRTDEAAGEIMEYQRLTRLLRPYRKVLPYSYWLRLRRYPMPDEAVEALRPFFIVEETASSA